MNEAWIQLGCSDCEKYWDETPMELPDPDADFACPDCGSVKQLSEFMRTERDLEVLKQFQEG